MTCLNCRNEAIWAAIRKYCRLGAYNKQQEFVSQVLDTDGLKSECQHGGGLVRAQETAYC